MEASQLLLVLYVSTTMIMKQMQKSLIRIKNIVTLSKMLTFVLNKKIIADSP